MTNEQSQPASETKPSHFGTRLQSAREALGFERKDVAAQLRLNEKVILMMEKDKYPADLPVTFIRGYLRAYGKLLQIPEPEVKVAIENVKPKPQTPPVFLTPMTLDETVNSSNYFMQFFTYLIIITLIALVGMWWYNHTPATAISEDKLTALPSQTLPITETVTPPLLAAAKPTTVDENQLDAEKKMKDHKKAVAVVKPKRKVIARNTEATDEASDQEHEEHNETNSDDAD